MSEVYFCGDLHICHDGILKHRPQIFTPNGSLITFKDNDHHDLSIVENIANTVTKRDTLYIVGDCCFETRGLHLLDLIKCRKFLVLGNHDTCHISEYAKFFDDVFGFVRYKNFWLSHCPIHPDELWGKINIHGHRHKDSIDDEHYINVCLDKIGHKPMSLTEIKKRIGETK